MDKIIINSKNKGIVSKEELQELAKNINKELGVEVRFSSPELLGTQVTLHDVIEFWFIADKFAKTKIGEKLIDTVLEFFKDWAKEKLKKEKKPRPKSVILYGPDGRILKDYTIDESGQEGESEKKQKFIHNPPKDSEPF